MLRAIFLQQYYLVEFMEVLSGRESKSIVDDIMRIIVIVLVKSLYAPRDSSVVMLR